MRYYPAPSALLSFSLGALIYFARKRNHQLVTPKGAALAGVMWFANLLAAGSLLPESYIYGVGFYIDIVLFMLMVAGLADVKGSPAIKRIDRAMGELAYPVFLLQWLIGLIVFETIMPGTLRGWPLILAMTPLLLLASAGLAFLQIRYIEPVRTMLRGASQSTFRPAFDPLPPAAAPAESLARD
jgi:peptidoglycan/LPS O-acetylase OafA/YrhL